MKEQKPKTCGKAAELADDYVWARHLKGDGEKPRRDPSSKYTVSAVQEAACGTLGEGLTEGLSSETQAWGWRESTWERELEGHSQAKEEPTGHYLLQLPEEGPLLFRLSEKCTQERRVYHKGVAVVKEQRVTPKPGQPKPGSIEGCDVGNILLDASCSQSLVRRDLVPEDKIFEGEVGLHVPMGIRFIPINWHVLRWR